MMVDFKTYDNKEFSLESNEGNVGILLSGGLDSLLLLTLLCEYFDRQRYIIFTIDKPDGKNGSVGYRGTICYGNSVRLL